MNDLVFCEPPDPGLLVPLLLPGLNDVFALLREDVVDGTLPVPYYDTTYSATHHISSAPTHVGQSSLFLRDLSRNESIMGSYTVPIPMIELRVTDAFDSLRADLSLVVVNLNRLAGLSPDGTQCGDGEKKTLLEKAALIAALPNPETDCDVDRGYVNIYYGEFLIHTFTSGLALRLGFHASISPEGDTVTVSIVLMAQEKKEVTPNG